MTHSETCLVRVLGDIVARAGLAGKGDKPDRNGTGIVLRSAAEQSADGIPGDGWDFPVGRSDWLTRGVPVEIW